MILNIKVEPPHAQTCTHKHVYPLHVLPQYIHLKRKIIMICLMLISKQVRML